MEWSPGQYAKYANERGRPFEDLVARIPAAHARHVVDLGCGPGTQTVSLVARFPGARVTGLDSSPAMIAEAEKLGSAVEFRVADVADFDARGTDVIVSNACLQWVLAHQRLVGEWSRALAPGGVIAFQVPGNFGSNSHRLMRGLAESDRWSKRLDGVLRHHESVAEPAQYARILLDQGLHADVWETTYLHVLHGTDPVLEWLRGTGLRPVLQALPTDQADEFEQEFADLLRRAYPPDAAGATVFPFRRIFVVGRRP